MLVTVQAYKHNLSLFNCARSIIFFAKTTEAALLLPAFLLHAKQFDQTPARRMTHYIAQSLPLIPQKLFSNSREADLRSRGH